MFLGVNRGQHCKNMTQLKAAHCVNDETHYIKMASELLSLEESLLVYHQSHLHHFTPALGLGGQ